CQQRRPAPLIMPLVVGVGRGVGLRRRVVSRHAPFHVQNVTGWLVTPLLLAITRHLRDLVRGRCPA
ncbi:MAG: hypothetical protein WBW25_04320, partial [Halobacteriota archaeon]